MPTTPNNAPPASSLDQSIPDSPVGLPAISTAIADPPASAEALSLFETLWGPTRPPEPEAFDLPEHREPLVAEHLPERKTEGYAVLSWKHREIIRLAAMGWRNTDIAEQVRMSPASISNILASPHARAEVRRLSKNRDEQAANVSSILQELAPKACAILDEVMNDEFASNKDKLAATKQVFDHTVPKVTISTSAPLHNGVLARIKQRAFGLPSEVLEVTAETA